MHGPSGKPFMPPLAAPEAVIDVLADDGDLRPYRCGLPSG
jgi:hypothetical protein